MLFTETPLAGAFVIDIQPHADERGFFARAFCRMEFEAHGLTPVIVQVNVGRSIMAGTLRGLHFQFPPHAETKVVRCTKGALFDVMVDLRPESPTFLKHYSIELTEDNHRALYIPKRFAHGYQVLADNTELSYSTDECYAAGYEGGLLYSDPELSIKWPVPVTSTSQKDRNWPLAAVQRDEIAIRMSI